MNSASHLWSCVATANGRDICGPHTQPAIQLHLRVSITPTQCGFKGTGALKSAVGSSFSHDVSRRKSERERGGQYWGTEFIQYYWDIYSLADRYGEPPIPAPVSDAALRRTLIQLHWGAMRCLHPSFKISFGGACTTLHQWKQVVMK